MAAEGFKIFKEYEFIVTCLMKSTCVCTNPYTHQSVHKLLKIVLMFRQYLRNFHGNLGHGKFTSRLKYL